MESLAIILNNPVVLAILLLVCLYTLNLISRGKVHRISKEGIDLIDNSNDDNAARVAKLEAAVNEIHTLIKEQTAVIKDIELATIRLQILSNETTLETKLKLFDIYKSKGGNSYISLYIEQLVSAAKEN